MTQTTETVTTTVTVTESAEMTGLMDMDMEDMVD
jgi:hypothetical protein